MPPNFLMKFEIGLLTIVMIENAQNIIIQTIRDYFRIKFSFYSKLLETSPCIEKHLQNMGDHRIVLEMQ